MNHQAYAETEWKHTYAESEFSFGVWYVEEKSEANRYQFQFIEITILVDLLANITT